MAEEKKDPVVQKNSLCPMPTPKRGYAMQTGSVTCDAGSYLTYCTASNVIVRNLDNPSDSGLFGKHKARVTCSSPSPNGELVASADEAGAMYIWGTKDRKVKYECTGASATDIAWSPDGLNVAVVGIATKGSAGYIFNLAAKKILYPILGYADNLLSCDFGNECFVTGDELGHITIHTGEDYQTTSRTKPHNQFINTLAFSPDKKNMVSISSDKTIVFYDENVKKVKDIQKAHKGSIYSCSWSPCSKYLLTASAGKTCKTWDVESGKSIKTFTFENNLNNMQMACNWVGEHLISFGLDGASYILNQESGDFKAETGIVSEPSAFGFDSSNKGFFIGERQGRIISYSPEGGMQVIKGKLPTSLVKNVIVSCDGETVWALDSNKTVHEIECKDLTISKTISLGGSAKWMAASNKDPSMFGVGMGEKIIIYKDGEILSENKVSFDAHRLNFSPDDKLVVVASENKKKILTYDFDGTSGKLSNEKVISSNFVGVPTQVKFGCRDDKLYISCSTKNGKIGIFLDTKKKNLDEWQKHSGTVFDHSWNPSGTSVVTCAADRHIIVWNDTDKFRSRHRHLLENAHPNNAKFIQWLDDKNFVSVGKSGMLKFWEVADV